MQPIVIFRDFEERDIDFIYKCKNDEKLNSMIVAQYHPFTYDEATEWVYGCMGEHETYKFWAIATNDDEQRIVGWVSLSNIDTNNKSACFHGIVIGDSDYNDGLAWIEAYKYILVTVFENMCFHRLYGSRLVGHKQSAAIGQAFGFIPEGIQRGALYRDGVYYDVAFDAILSEEYFALKESREYDDIVLIKKIVSLRKKNNLLIKS